MERLSNLKDRLPVIVSERLVDINEFEIGKLIYLEGQFRSYNQSNNGKNRLVLNIFVKEIKFPEAQEHIKTLNEVTLYGYICKPPIYRKTPLGREIADILIAVNRTYRKSDYVPCILWGRNAKFCETLGVGSEIKVSGRIQAREYEKKYEDGTSKVMIAYEISVSKFGVINENENQKEETDTQEEKEEYKVEVSD